MPAPFPHHYHTELEWLDSSEVDGRAAALKADGKPVIIGGPPPQFDGRPEWWSPEELFLESINLCLFTTYQTLATKKDIPLKRYRSHVEAALDKTRDGLVFTKIEARLEIDVEEKHVPSAVALVDSAKHYCIISNATKVPVEVRADVKAAR